MKKLLLILLCFPMIFSCGEKEGCISGDCENGQGTFIDKWGCKYVGEWKNGRYDGQGIRTYSDESKYVGEWKDGQYHGQGKKSEPSGSYYEGGWKKGKQDGYGTEYWKGDIFVGEFEMHEKKKGKMTYRNGKVEEGLWENNRIKK